MPERRGGTGRGRIIAGRVFTGKIYEFTDGQTRLIASGHRGADGIERGLDGTLYVSEVTTGRVWAIAPGGQETLLTDQPGSAADFLFDREQRQLVVPDTKAGIIIFVPLPPAS